MSKEKDREQDYRKMGRDKGIGKDRAQPYQYLV